MGEQKDLKGNEDIKNSIIVERCGDLSEEADRKVDERRREERRERGERVMGKRM